MGVKRPPGGGPPAAPPLDLHIERLVVRGPGLPGRHRLAPAIQAELERLIAERGLPAGLAGGGSAVHLPGGTYRVKAGAGAEAIGAEIARRLHAAWSDGD